MDAKDETDVTNEPACFGKRSFAFIKRTDNQQKEDFGTNSRVRR